MATERVDILITGGQLASGSGTRSGNLAVRDGKFVALPDGATPDAGRVIDATGKLVLPGVIDSHVHPVYDDDLEATSRTAALGGVTSLIGFVGAIPAWGKQGTLTEAIKTFIEDGNQRAHIDYGIHGTITAADDPIPQLPELIKMGVPSFKCYMSYKKRGMMLTDEDILPFWAALTDVGGLAMVHAENGAIVDLLEDRLIAAGDTGYDSYIRTHPALEEVEAVVRAIALAQTAGCPLHVVHLTVKLGKELVARLRPELVSPLFVETCPHYLLLTNQAVLDRGPLAKIGPPIRTQSDSEALWAGLADRTLDTVATDHCGFTTANKMACNHILDAKYGGNGIGALLPLTYSEGVRKGRISLERMIQLLCENPARIFGLADRKGSLEVGKDADLVIVDPDQTYTITAANQGGNIDYTLYEGWQCQGRPVLTMQRGKVLAENGRLLSSPGDGQFLPGWL